MMHTIVFCQCVSPIVDLLAEEIPIKETFARIIEFFAEHIPNYLRSYVLTRLSAEARFKLFSTLAVLAF